MTEKARQLGNESIAMDSGSMPYAHMGLTKREYYAGLAMQSLISYYFNTLTLIGITKESIDIADALLEELSK